MSTNPFRQIRPQPGLPSGRVSPPPDSQPPIYVPDGSRASTAGLLLDTKVPSSLDRHVSFASPPVDTTIPAASYPSSPESTRFSPPLQSAQPVAFTHRDSFHTEPFQDFRRNGREDQTIQQALSNAQYSTTVSHDETRGPNGYTVEDTLGRFASAPRPAQQLTAPSASQLLQATRQSLDVEAFQRLLLTGDSGQTTPGASTPPVLRVSDHSPLTSSGGVDTTPPPLRVEYNVASQSASDHPTSLHAQEVQDTNKPALPPPAPAPRRGKSMKASMESSSRNENLNMHPNTVDVQITDHDKKRPPTPPLARRRSQRTAQKNEELVVPIRETGSPNQSNARSQNPPPPPSIRRQASLSQRRPSTDLAPTIEEPENQPVPSIGSRRSSADRPPAPPSRTSSTSAKRQSLALMNPPPLPPPRRGRGSSRSSSDSFRPSLASIMGDGSAYENVLTDEGSRRSSTKDHRNVTPLSPDNILTELANLQKEVDAARRGA